MFDKKIDANSCQREDSFLKTFTKKMHSISKNPKGWRPFQAKKKITLYNKQVDGYKPLVEDYFHKVAQC